MSKAPYWAMIGAIAGFTLGVLFILVTATDFSLDKIADYPNDSASLPVMQLRIVLLVLCVVVGLVTGFLSSFIFSEKKSSSNEAPR